MDSKNAIRSGSFASRQIYGKTWLISWGHRRRFKVALDIARDFAGKRICDFGCGDGTFLALLMESDAPPSAAMGADKNPTAVQDCRRRLGSIPGLSFIETGGSRSEREIREFDGVFCMEVLEHTLDPDAVLEDLDRLLAPTGRLVISVPVETGPPLLIKQAARRLAGLRGVKGYVHHSGYSLSEWWAAMFAGPETKIPRVVHGEGEGRVYDHKGFNWMSLREAVARRFDIQVTISSPLRWLPPGLGSQVWLVAGKKRTQRPA